jgi:hypothetical protein
MLSNTLSLLLWQTLKLGTPPDAPVFYTHRMGQDHYQIIVQKIPKQEVMAA